LHAGLGVQHAFDAVQHGPGAEHAAEREHPSSGGLAGEHELTQVKGEIQPGLLAQAEEPGRGASFRGGARQWCPVDQGQQVSTQRLEQDHLLEIEAKRELGTRRYVLDRVAFVMEKFAVSDQAHGQQQHRYGRAPEGEHARRYGAAPPARARASVTHSSPPRRHRP
jgi:hypothetical protein